MTPPNGNISHVTGLLCGEFTGHRPVTRSLDVLFDLRLNQQMSNQWRRRWFETPWRALWRHCNICSLLRHCVFGIVFPLYHSKLLHRTFRMKLWNSVRCLTLSQIQEFQSLSCESRIDEPRCYAILIWEESSLSRTAPENKGRWVELKILLEETLIGDVCGLQMLKETKLVVVSISASMTWRVNMNCWNANTIIQHYCMKFIGYQQKLKAVKP